MAQVDSNVVDQLQTASGATREVCEKALSETDGNYDDALRKLTAGRTRGVDLNEIVYGLGLHGVLGTPPK